MNKNSNVAVVTLHVLVNTDDMDETMKQLNERVTTHECVIDISVSMLFMTFFSIEADYLKRENMIYNLFEKF